jgi:hypothetical protein
MCAYTDACYSGFSRLKLIIGTQRVDTVSLSQRILQIS